MRFRTPSGRIGKLTLGPFDPSGSELEAVPTVGQPLTLAAARTLAVATHRQRALGHDPIADHKARKHRQRIEIEEHHAGTFVAAVRAYIDEHAKPETRNWRETARLLGLDYPLDRMRLIPLIELGLAAEKKGEHDWPPIINLSEAKGLLFEKGKAELTTDFETRLRTEIVQRVLDLAQKYRVTTIEVIGHTDEQKIAPRNSNLDASLVGILHNGAARNVVGILRSLISSDVKLSDCRSAFKQRSGREGEPLGSPLVSFSRGVQYLSTPFFMASITRQDLSVDR